MTLYAEQAQQKITRLENELVALKKRLAEAEEKRSNCEERSIASQHDQALFSAGPVVLFSWLNRPGWPVEHVSANVESVLGYAADDFMRGAVNFREMIHPEDRARVVEEVERHAAQDSDRFTHEPYRIVTPGGEERWMLDQRVSIRDDQGAITHYAGYLLDITWRVESEQRLVENERRWRIALEGARDGVWDWDLSTGRVYFSRQWKSMLGYAPEEVGETHAEWVDRLHPEDQAQAQAALEAHLDGETPYYETVLRLRCKDGSYKWILTRGMVTDRDAAGKPLRVVGMHTDISEYKDLQAELEQARQHITDILESTTDAFFELDRDFNLTYANKLAVELLRVGRGDIEVVGLNLFGDLFPNAVGSLFHIEYSRALYEQKVADFESYLPEHEAWYEVHAYPTPESLSVYFRDITAKKRLELEREQIFNLSIDMICVASVDGYLKKLNPAWTKVLGWSEEELTGRPWLEFVHPDDREATIQAGEQLLQGREVAQFQNRYICKDGSSRWLSWNSVPAVEEGLVFGVVRDVTEQAETTRALEDSEERFRVLVEKATVGMALTDSQLNVLFMNAKFKELTGYDESDIGNVDDWLRLSWTGAGDYRDALARFLKAVEKAHRTGAEPPVATEPVRCKDGSLKIMQRHYVPIDDRALSIFIDVTEQDRLSRELKRLASTDSLTGIANRGYFMHRAAGEVERSRRYGRNLSLLIIDADRFKSINDAYGHDVGDRVLQAITANVRETLREVDIFGRIGGEEFAAVLPETGLGEAIIVAERLRMVVDGARVSLEDGGEVSFTISLGVAQLLEGQGLEDLLKRADGALYQAKGRGRNMVVAS